MKPSLILSTALAFSTFSAAWPWPPSMNNIRALSPVGGSLQRRQNSNDNQQTSTAAPASKSTSTASSTGSSSNSKQTDSKSDSKSSSTGKSKSGSKSTATKTSSVSIDPAAGAGGVKLLDPATTAAAAQYYKVDNTITWVWNYTSLTSAPAGIDILATLGANQAGVASAVPSPYTIATNFSFHSTQTFMWDTGKYASETSLLPVGTYTLLIYDAALPTYSATASPGYLGLFNQFTFGMYTGQPRVDLTPMFACATCNDAAGGLEALTVRCLFGVVGVTVASFMWFAGVWGVF